MIFHKKKIFW